MLCRKCQLIIAILIIYLCLIVQNIAIFGEMYKIAKCNIYVIR